ncbi:MAG: diaminopimelate epimerase [Mobilicoccus sp.]|nr:diaminopimelate epimerase [Mobilicoccus sp.]
MTHETLPFVKGHGTENDFVLVPDPEGVHDLSDAQVRLLADRQAGIGGDGVIRVVPTRHATEPAVRALADDAPWFMDYRNADGSRAEMCGNGTRVFAAFLQNRGWASSDTIPIATRAGIKTAHVERGAHDEVTYAVEVGPWSLVDPGAEAQGYDTLVALPGLEPLPGLSFSLGNPHVVVVIPEHVDLMSLDLTQPPVLNPAPEGGANVELAQPLGPGHLQMRVHERGVGETRSCGTGAAAAALALTVWSGADRNDATWRVDVPGGTLTVRARPDQRVELAGPAVLVAEGQVWVPSA